MNWLRWLFPRFFKAEESLQHAITNALRVSAPMSYLDVEYAILGVCKKFGIRDGGFTIVWASIPALRTSIEPREAGVIRVIVRLAMLPSLRSDCVIQMRVESQWYAPVRKKFVIGTCLQYNRQPEPYNFDRKMISETPPDDIHIGIEDVCQPRFQ